MNKFNFEPVNGLLDRNIFPTQPQSEEAARGQFMTLFNQLKDYNNNIVYEALLPLVLNSEKTEVTIKDNGRDFALKFPMKINGKVETMCLQSAISLSRMANTEVKNVNYIEPFANKVLFNLSYVESVEGESAAQYSCSGVNFSKTSFSQTIISRLNDNVARNIYTRYITLGY